MDFRIADTFTDALARLPAPDQKAVKVSVMDLQLNTASPGLQLHRIDKSKDEHFWSARVGRDLRLILHRTSDAVLVAYVDHHDRAYAWAERRKIEAHPRTGVIQIVEVRERVEEAQPDLARLWSPTEAPAGVAEAPAMFAALSHDDLLAVGVPEDWIDPLLVATETGFYELADHLPAEASEALLEYATTGVLSRSAPEAAIAFAAKPFQHPDARRRFLTVESSEELAAALEAPWEKWSVFLHPSQRAVVERIYGGPARVAGTAGTGKTVVALHRAARAVREDPGNRVLLATFSEPLAASLASKLNLLATPSAASPPRATVASFEGVALDLFQLAFGRKPRLASDDHVAAALSSTTSEAGLTGFSQRFLMAEWHGVIDAWRVADADAYATVPRLGRRNRLGAKQRSALWPVFDAARQRLRTQGLMTWATVFHELADHYAARDQKPFTHIVVDEAQDLGVPELRLMIAAAPPGSDRLFFAGDLGQRIFQQPFSWKSLGADVRGRSATLKVNYRTSRQIREAADCLLPDAVRDVDGLEEDRRGAVSVFEGPSPEVALAADAADEKAKVAAFLKAAVSDGIGAGEIGVFVRSRRELPRARDAVTAAGLECAELSERSIDTAGRIAVGVMHLAKGLEFKAVVAMACDDDVLPLAERVDAVVEESDLDDVYDTERHLLYVACTRARDRLLVTGVSPGSEFLADMKEKLSSSRD
jgi:mRNA-degrading endonuclease RelE of RelBE toxin-antitoxin system